MSLVTTAADSTDYDSDNQHGLVQRTLTTAVKPVQALTSRTAVKAYLSTILFFVTSIGLLSLSTVAYAFFYYNYIPQINLEKTVYLQYGLGSYPQATTALDAGALISQQAYDIELILHMPRTPSNLAAGNFMLDLKLLGQGPSTPNIPIPDSLSSLIPNITSAQHVLHHSRRPAILPYVSPILSLSHQLLHLPWHLLHFRDLDSSYLTIPMFEMLSFARGSRNVPSHIRLELQSSANSNVASPLPFELQVYSTKIAFRARFQGLRYAIYNHRVMAFLVFSAVFYVTSLASMAAAWAAMSSFFAPKDESNTTLKIEGGEAEKDTIKQERGDEADTLSNGRIKSVKHEEEEDSDEHGLSLSNLSDSAAQFPSGRGQMPLRFPGRTSSGSDVPSSSSQTKVKRGEVGDDEDEGDRTTTANIKREDEDDEEEEERERLAKASRFDDSGIGTSMESENTARTSGTGASGPGLVRRRSGRQSQSQK